MVRYPARIFADQVVFVTMNGCGNDGRLVSQTLPVPHNPRVGFHFHKQPARLNGDCCDRCYFHGIESSVVGLVSKVDWLLAIGTPYTLFRLMPS